MKKFILILFVLGILPFGLSPVEAQGNVRVTDGLVGGITIPTVIEDAQRQVDDVKKNGIQINSDKDTLGGDCLNGVGKNCFRYEEIIGIDKSGKEHTALSIVQDVIYAATYMVGTVLTIVIIWCGLGYIIAARGGKDTNAYRKGLINGAIGAILVLTAYTIVRLIQYIAKG